MNRLPKHYDRQFKIDCVEMYLSSNKSMKKIAEDFGVCYPTFCGWVAEYKRNGQHAFKGKGIIKESNAELVALKKELADVKLERDILKKAAAIFLNPKK
ncbi:MAG: transposase [Chlamydiales bacterium]